MALVADAKAYFAAVAQCPLVVQRETPLDLFLQFCNDDAWCAADRLSYYWTMRLGILKKDCFQPLEHALKPCDWQLLLQGTFFATIEGDRSVLFFDRVKYRETHTKLLRPSLRALLQCFQVMQNSRSTSKFELVMRVGGELLSSDDSSPPPDDEDQTLFAWVHEFSERTLCVKPLTELHLISSTATGAARSFLRMTYGNMLSTLLGRAVPVDVHAPDSTGEVIRSLGPHQAFDLAPAAHGSVPGTFQSGLSWSSDLGCHQAGALSLDSPTLHSSPVKDFVWHSPPYSPDLGGTWTVEADNAEWIRRNVVAADHAFAAPSNGEAQRLCTAEAVDKAPAPVKLPPIATSSRSGLLNLRGDTKEIRPPTCAQDEVTARGGDNPGQPGDDKASANERHSVGSCHAIHSHQGSENPFSPLMVSLSERRQQLENELRRQPQTGKLERQSKQSLKKERSNNAKGTTPGRRNDGRRKDLSDSRLAVSCRASKPGAEGDDKSAC